MKKFIAIPLLILYLTAVSGMMVQIHFCGTELSAWNVNKARAVCCCEESGNEKAGRHLQQTDGGSDNDCCTDKTITLKIAEAQNKVSDVQVSFASVQLTTLPGFSFPDFIFSQSSLDATHLYAAHAPPGLWQSIPLYRLYSSFTIYG